MDLNVIEFNPEDLQFWGQKKWLSYIRGTKENFKYDSFLTSNFGLKIHFIEQWATHLLKTMCKSCSNLKKAIWTSRTTSLFMQFIQSVSIAEMCWA